VSYRIENGTTLTDIAAEVTAVMGEIVRPTLVREAAIYDHDPGRARERIKASQAQGANAFVEEAKHIIDNVAPDREAIAKAKEQANIRTFIASRWNRKEWGEQKGPDVSVSIGSLHIDALRSRRAARATAVAEQVSEVIEGVVEEITDVVGDVMATEHLALPSGM
jgi:hypothetical protein